MRRRLVRAVAGALFILLSLALYVGFAPAGDSDPHAFNRDRNAVWLEHRWLEREHPESEIETLLSALSGRGVRYVFPHLIPFNGAGRLPPHSREQMRRFLATARRVDPAMKVLPWVGGLRAGYRRTLTGSLSLADLGQRQRMVAECRGLMDEGFDGIHLNVEPVDDGNVEFLALLHALRTAVGEDHILSVAATRPGPFSLPVARNFFWTPAYYARVADLADQIVVMAYDTGLPTANSYRRYLAYAASSVTGTLASSSSHARLLMGIPTYAATGRMHRGSVETPENALLGVVAGLRRASVDAPFEGVALYAEWTTNAAEWDIYERLWRRRPTTAGTSPLASSSLPGR